MEEMTTNQEFVQEAEVQPVAEQPAAAPQPVYPQAQPQEKKDGVVNFWTFLGLIVLFAIPIVGFIACIVFMFAPKKQSLKNYARAMMVWMVANVVSTVLVVSLVLSLLGGMLLPSINEALNTEFDSFGEVLSIAGAAARGDYGSVLSHFEDQLIDQMGEEYAPFVKELCSGDYNDLFTKLQNGDYDAIANSIENGDYDGLLDTLDKETADEFVKEIQAAANGDVSDALNELKNMIPTF